MYVFHQATSCNSSPRCVVGQVTLIDVLPDDVLLDIFDFYAGQD